MSDLLKKINTYSLLIEELIKKTCEYCPFERTEIVEKPYDCIYDTFSQTGKLKNESFDQFRNKYGYIANKSMQELISEKFSFEDMINDFENL